MPDARYLKASVIVLLALCVLAIAYNIASEYFFPDVESYIQRRLYYERVISKKGLSLHRSRYFSEEK